MAFEEIFRSGVIDGVGLRGQDRVCTGVYIDRRCEAALSSASSCQDRDEPYEEKFQFGPVHYRRVKEFRGQMGDGRYGSETSSAHT
jgi:hypothetical protein